MEDAKRVRCAQVNLALFGCMPNSLGPSCRPPYRKKRLSLRSVITTRPSCNPERYPNHSKVPEASRPSPEAKSCDLGRSSRRFGVPAAPASKRTGGEPFRIDGLRSWRPWGESEAPTLWRETVSRRHPSRYNIDVTGGSFAIFVCPVRRRDRQQRDRRCRGERADCLRVSFIIGSGRDDSLRQLDRAVN